MTAVDLLHSRHCVEVLGELGSGRSYFLQRIRTHFATIGWHTVEIAGVKSSQNVNFTALDMAGIFGALDGQASPFADAHRSLSKLVKSERTVILIDDAEWVDDASWSVINSVSGKLGAAVIFARSVHALEHETVRPAGGASAVYSLVLEAMSYAEMETLLEGMLDASIEAQTMSRIFAKAGGNIGIAWAIVEAGRRTRTIEMVDGVARAKGPLWNPMLNSLVKTILQQLSAQDQAALRTLSLLGPADIGTASRLVAREQILLLEERMFLTMLETRGGITVMVRLPLLVEYFRYETTPGLRAEMMSRIENELILRRNLEIETELYNGADSALFVRLVHEKTRLRTLRAREAWRKHQSLATANEYLLALTADSTSSSEEVAVLTEGIAALQGSDAEHADWEITHALHRAYNDGEKQLAVKRLEEVAALFPSEAPRLLAQAFLLRTDYEPLPETEPFAELDLKLLKPESASLVLLARSYWRLVTGDTVAADRLLREHCSAEPVDSRLATVWVYTRLALDQYGAAIDAAESRFARAVADLDGPSIRAYAFVNALVAVLTHRFDDAEEILETAASLGIPAGATPASYVGIGIMRALFAVRKGQLSLMQQYLTELDNQGYGDGVLPGLQRAMVYSHAEIAKGDLSSASRIYRDSGDELWARGARFAAAYAYLDAMQLAPDLATWEHSSARLQELDSPAIENWVSFVDPLVRGDTKAVAEIVEALGQDNAGIDSNRLAQVAITAFSAQSDRMKKTDPALQSLRDMAAVRKQQEPVGAVVLSAREHQVAELIASGLSNPRIAEALVLSIRTVESHVNRLMKKIGAHNRSDIRAYLRETDA